MVQWAKAEGWVFESQPRQTYVVKQVVTAPLLNAWQYLLVSRVFGDDHHKRIPRVSVRVAR